MRRGVLVLWSHLAWLLCWAAADASPLFEDDSVLDIELRGPLRETLRDTSTRAERAFVLAVDGTELDVGVRVRGKSRVVTCRFPPLRLRLDGPGETVFAGQDKVKLVTHCQKAAAYELNVLEEYAAYRLLALLTPSAMRVRLLRVRYVDTGRRGNAALERYALLLEPERHLATRLGGKLVKLEGVALNRLHREQIASVFVAQYLIGNTDYSLVTAKGDDACCHNGILVEVEGRLHYVPYDLDRTRLVDPGYARPKLERGRRSRGRRYVGYCMDDLDLDAAIRRVRDAREQVFAEVRAVEAISGHELGRATRFLEGFFREAEDPAALRARFEKSCLE